MGVRRVGGTEPWKVCEHCPQPTHTSLARTRDFFFTFGSRLESSSQDSQCLSQTVVLTCTPIRPSNQPSTRLSLMSTSHVIYPAPIHRMCLSVPWLKRTRLQVMCPKIPLKRTLLYWSTDVLPQTEYDVDV